MFRSYTVRISLLLCLLAGPAGAQILGGGVGQVIGAGVGGQSSTAGSIAAGGGGTLLGDGVGATIDLNFATNTAYVNGISTPVGNLISTNRGAPPAYADDTAGNWHAFGKNIPRITDKGLLVEESRTQLVTNTVGSTGGGWQPDNVTFTPNQSSPAGDTSAFLTASSNTGSAQHFPYIGVTLVASTTYTTSAFFKYNGMRYISMMLGDGGPTDYAYVNIDLVAGVITQTGQAGLGTYTSSGITVYANGWMRVWVTGNLGTVTGGLFLLALDLPTGTSSPAGNYTGSLQPVAVWNPQIEAGTFPTSPIPNTSGSAVVRASDTIKVISFPTLGPGMTIFGQGVPIAPPSYTFQGIFAIFDGTNRLGLYRDQADAFASGVLTNTLISGPAWTTNVTGKLAIATGNPGTQSFVYNGSAPFTASTSTTWSPVNDISVGGLQQSSSPFDGYVQRVAFWATTKVSNAGMQALTSTPGILQGDGVQASVDLNFVANTGFNQGLIAAPASMLTVNRTTTGGVGSYVDDTSGNWTLVPDNVLRQSNKGALIEEQRTNGIPNNSTQGAVVGSPGTMPTGWSTVGVPAGVTVSVVSMQTTNGIDTITFHVVGTPGSVSGLLFTAVTPSIIAAAVSQTWTNSMFVQLSNTTNIGVSTGLVFLSISSGGAGIGTYANFTGGAALPLTLTRLTQTATISSADTGTAFVWPSIQLELDTGNAVNFNITIGWPQMEQGSFATSPIRTIGGAVTRSNEIVSLTTMPFVGTAITLFAQASYPFDNVPVFISMDDGTLNNRFVLYENTGYSNEICTIANATASALSDGVWPVQTMVKGALAYTAGSQAITVSGNGPTAGANATAIPAPTYHLWIGNQAGQSNFPNAYFGRAAFWPTYRVSNAGLQTITGP